VKKNFQPSQEDFRDDLRRQQNRISELERQLADIAGGKFPEESRLEPDLIECSSMVSSATHEPMVMIRWFTHTAQLSIRQARDLAFNLLDASEASQSDAFITAFASERIGIKEMEKVGALLVEFRNFRVEFAQRQAEKERLEKI
jgi:hypothetical protein